MRMTGRKNKADKSTGTKGTAAENVLFIICLVIIALRVTFTEAPTSQSAQIQAAINDTVYSLCLSGASILTFLIWIVVNIYKGRFSFKPTIMAIGLAVFVAVAVVAVNYAGNKRAAITSAITLIAAILMAFMLKGLLNSQARIKILLTVIAALGVVACWQSAEQYLISNAIMIEQYKDEPNSILEPLGIEPGSLNQMLLEHRIFSKGVRASFTTSNSAGSFAILTCFAAMALLAERIKARKRNPAPVGNYVLSGFILAASLISLFITRSKGATAAFLGALIIFIVLTRSRRRKLTKNVILAVSIVGIIVLAPVVGWYGEKFGRLPGGNSMLVRWQYWRASAEMFFDNVLTGAGPGNFTWAYQHYKPGSAPETVSDPHSFVLSILTQYGVIGLAAFLVIVLVPLFRTSLTVPEELERGERTQFAKMATICGFAIAAVVLMVRPFILPRSAAQTIDEKIYVLFTEYLAAPAAFAVGFGVIIKSLQRVFARDRQSPPQDEFALQSTAITATALFCGLFGVLIHNLIDFAILEPGILTTFFACLGCLMALNSQTTGQQTTVRKGSGWFAAGAAAVVLVFCYGYFKYALIPVAKSTAKITESRQYIPQGQFGIAHNLLALATEDDKLSPEAASMNGRLYLQHYYWPVTNKQELLTEAEETFFIAVERNPEDYKNYESIGEVYFLRARESPGQKDQWLNEALVVETKAVELYPGNSDLHYRFAEIAEEAGQKETALKHYQEAIRIEDGFREQFKVMYPGREVFSRLGVVKYEEAKERVKKLILDER